MNRYLKYILFAALVIAIASCSTTKRLGESDVLYTGVKKMKIESSTDEKLPGSAKSDVQDAFNVKPNNPLYSPYIRTPLPIGLWVWNSFYTEDNKGFKAWVYRNLAKQPVLISNVQPELRVGLAQDILDNLGYFGSSADYEIVPKKNPKKARISYYVSVPQEWRYDSVAFPEPVCPVTTLIDTLEHNTNLVRGAQYNIDTLTRERIRITNFLRERSYYYFRPDYIEYLADTTRERYKVDLRMVMARGIPDAALQPYKIGDVTVRLYNPTGGDMDSMYYNDIKVVYQKKLKLRPKVLSRMLTIKPGDPIRVSDISTTLNNMTKLGVFRYVNTTVTPLDSLMSADSTRIADKIDLDIAAAFDNPLEAEFEADFASKSNSFIGPGAIFSVRHKNFLRGGEVFSVRATGSYEWQTGNRSSEANSTAINSYELGLTASLMFPRLLIPKFIHTGNRFDKKTTFSLGASILNRPNFFTMASFNFATSWDFQTSANSTHNLTLFKFSYNHLLRTTESFDNTMAQNPAIALSFENQFIPSASYTYTYDRRYGRLRQHRYIWQTTAMTAGNIFAGAWGLFGESPPKKIFGNQFSQFVKGTSEFKHYYRIGEKNTLASRVFVGVGYAYGNSRVMPYSEQFYIGGANSIRAFTVRSIGPGTYVSDSDDQYGYFDQTGDIKFEANVEFRFGIIGGLNGAVFLDVGNIWLIRNDPVRPGGKFSLSGFFNQLATGTGAGLRYDISYLVIRADLGIGIHTPYSSSRSGYYNIPKFKDGLGFHLAIGYPF